MGRELFDVTTDSPRTRTHGVRVGTEEPRPWLAKFAVCPALARYQILHTGFESAYVPFRIVRVKQTTSYFLACFGGKGRVMVDGRWQSIEPGTACLLPPYIRIEFCAVGTNPWDFCYVCYARPENEPPVAQVSSPMLAPYDPQPLRCAIQGLETECRGPAVPAVVHHWVELIQNYVQRFAYPVSADDPLHLLWEKVSSNLNAPWTLDELARQAHCSKEHLRRLCGRHLGRSPMAHLTWLRLQRAAELLVSTNQKVETIAHELGYSNAFAFSVTFKRWIGWAPKAYRARMPASRQRQ